MATHYLKPDRSTVHGVFSRDISPALEISLADHVRASTIDVSWGLEPPTDTTTPRKKLEPRDEAIADGPAMIGPVFVRGVSAGDVLKVTIESLVPGSWGWTYAGGAFPTRAHAMRLGIDDEPLTLVRWTIRDGVATSDRGWRVACAPFLGTIGVCPGERVTHDGWRPRRTGGNMDCKELVVGTTLYLPVEADGALLSFGDGHAAQSDGELAGDAIECMMDEVVLSVDRADQSPVDGVWAETPSGWVTLGFDEDLDRAMDAAAGSMLDLISHRLGVSRAEATVLASVAADARLTQVVNGVRGVHVVFDPDRVG